jgi:hypothetical protein
MPYGTVSSPFRKGRVRGIYNNFPLYKQMTSGFYLAPFGEGDKGGEVY